MNQTKMTNEELLEKAVPETYDCIKFAKDFVADLDKHMADDGKIDGYEIGLTFLENIPGALATWTNAGKIPEEVKTMPEEAKDAALEELLGVVQSIAALVEKRKK